MYEKIHENALVVDFKLLGILYSQQQRFDVRYKNHSVGFYVPDLIAFGQVIVDAKTVDYITDEDRGKMINYLKVTGFRVGLILNFKHPRLQFERIALWKSKAPIQHRRYLALEDRSGLESTQVRTTFLFL